MNDLVKQLRSSFEEKANQMKAYMKDKFTFLGVPAGMRKACLAPICLELKQCTQSEILKYITILFKEEEREFHQAAVDILNKYSKKLVAEDIQFLEHLITTNSWWDTVDMIASNALGTLCFNYKSELEPWLFDAISSENIWLNRSAIIHQLKYKSKLDTEF